MARVKTTKVSKIIKRERQNILLWYYEHVITVHKILIASYQRRGVQSTSQKFLRCYEKLSKYCAKFSVLITPYT